MAALGAAQGEGPIDEKGNQPHAKGELPAAAPPGLLEVWCKDQKREIVPVSSRGG